MGSTSASTLGLLVMLAACAVSPPDTSVALRPGVGVVEAVRPTRVALPPAAEHYQLTLRMDDGSSQRVTQDSAAFRVGDRVQVTTEGRVVKVPAVATPAPVVTTPAPTVTAPAVTTPAPTTYRPGVGIVESASVVSLPSSTSAAAGGRPGTATTPTMAYRLRMADGTTQDVVQAGERFQVGDRVQMTSNGRLIRP